MNDKIRYVPLIGLAVLATACQTNQPDISGADHAQPAPLVEPMELTLPDSVAGPAEDQPQARPMTRVWTVQVDQSGAVSGNGMLAVVDTVVAEIGSWSHIEHIEITGHTDDIGSDSDNQALSVKRADAVAEQLLMAGIEEHLIAHRGKGESEPRVNNDDAQSRALNRRVEIRVTGLGVPAADGDVALQGSEEFSQAVMPAATESASQID